MKRVNVASGRTLEQIAHYSRAVRVGDTVLQAGTTAIDRRGNVRGVGDVVGQVDAIMAIAGWSIGKPAGAFTTSRASGSTSRTPPRSRGDGGRLPRRGDGEGTGKAESPCSSSSTSARLDGSPHVGVADREDGPGGSAPTPRRDGSHGLS